MTQMYTAPGSHPFPAFGLEWLGLGKRLCVRPAAIHFPAFWLGMVGTRHAPMRVRLFVCCVVELTMFLTHLTENA